MASGFESERVLAAHKEDRRRQREALLQQAKANYEKDERRKELKRLRGEDTWMLNDVNERLEEMKKEHAVTKKKHSKKYKKEKKKKKTKREKTDDSSDTTSGSSEEWVEAPVAQSSSTEQTWKAKKEQSEEETVKNPTSIQRDEWMTLDFMSVKTVSSAALKAEKQKEKILKQQKAQENEQLLLSERELNPYWKDGGTGLPTEVSTSVKATTVEDGGLSWLMKSYERMKEQSEREKRGLEEIVAERYGSVELFHSKLREAETAAVQKENDRKDWQKCKYSESKRTSRDGKEKQEENNLERFSCKEQLKEKYNKVCSEEPKNYRGSEQTETKKSRPSNKESTAANWTCTTRKDPHQLNHYEKPFSSSVKAAFLKPSNDGDKGGRQQRTSSQLLTPRFMSCGFRKPVDDANVTPRWRKAQPKDEIGKATPNEKSSETNKAVTSKEEETKEKEQISEAAVEEKKLVDSKPSCSRSVSEDEMPLILSDEEMNKLGARIVKAELMGNKDLAAKLQSQLDKVRMLKDSGAQAKARKTDEKTSFQEDHEAILVRTDKSGRAWPVNISEETLDHVGRRRKNQMIPTHVDKERIRYFQDDDNLDLKDLIRNEKMSTSQDQNKLFMRMASKFSDKTDRDYYTLDDMFVSQAAKKEESGKAEERERNQAIREHRQLAACMEKCPHCFGSSELPKHLIIAIGNKVYLSLPKYQSLTEGHCLITPMQHYTAATVLDEDIWEEIQVFRKTLVKMFEAEELDCVFLETNLSISKQYHMVYECIPLPKEVGDMAPIYFKKAIMESDEEWAMNKKLINLGSKDVRKSVPKGLPYFSVDFGLQGGFAHVIENQYKFPHYFGKEIIGGMLDLEPRLWRKGLRENFEDQRKKVLHFAQKWKLYDFTKSKE
ncbi:CWF19-like protein 2 [Pituophis catenifer annectens]|uniref:CWF19-like protein 2 n=1 Tax=Pituophis catenifer annectens TaxID=94852 RepID=UPI0039911C81